MNIDELDEDYEEEPFPPPSLKVVASKEGSATGNMAETSVKPVATLDNIAEVEIVHRGSTYKIHEDFDGEGLLITVGSSDCYISIKDVGGLLPKIVVQDPL